MGAPRTAGAMAKRPNTNASCIMECLNIFVLRNWRLDGVRKYWEPARYRNVLVFWNAQETEYDRDLYIYKFDFLYRIAWSVIQWYPTKHELDYSASICYMAISVPRLIEVSNRLNPTKIEAIGERYVFIILAPTFSFLYGRSGVHSETKTKIQRIPFKTLITPQWIHANMWTDNIQQWKSALS